MTWQSSARKRKVGPERFDPFFRAEIPRWKEIVRVTGVAQAR
jgi:hypothetical protein